mgnify:CR=1 FL=1
MPSPGGTKSKGIIDQSKQNDKNRGFGAFCFFWLITNNYLCKLNNTYNIIEYIMCNNFSQYIDAENIDCIIHGICDINDSKIINNRLNDKDTHEFIGLLNAILEISKQLIKGKDNVVVFNHTVLM